MMMRKVFAVPVSINTTTSLSTDTRRFSQQTETKTDKSGEKKRKNWKKKKMTRSGLQLSLIPHFSDCVIYSNMLEAQELMPWLYKKTYQACQEGIF